MLCEKCKKNLATVFVTKVINNQKTEHVLCIDCAKSENAFPVDMEGGVSVDSLLKGFFNLAKANEPENLNKVNVVCPVCGMDMNKLAEKGRFGCDECYKVFGDTALNIIKRIHGHKRHIGKLPERYSGTIGVKRKLVDLRTKLEGHVIKEEYEEAAKLRDEIRQLEKQMPTSKVTEVSDDSR